MKIISAIKKSNLALLLKRHYKRTLISMLAAILLGLPNWLMVEEASRNWLFDLHIITPVIAFAVLWFIGYTKTGLNWYSLLFIVPYGFAYWLIYDWTLGFLLTGNIFHLGTTGIDVFFARVFQNGFQLSLVKIMGYILTLSFVDRLYYYSKHSS
jgi:hypothetical protein